MKDLNQKNPTISLEHCTAERIELDLHNYEVKNEDGKWVIVQKKPFYPDNLEQCCLILNLPFQHSNGLSMVWNTQGEYKYELMNKLQSLIICRDAYWKTANDWKPDWTNTSQIKYSIWFDNDGICMKNNRLSYAIQHILTFPTIEMRDKFYENFKESIESCKELL